MELESLLSQFVPISLAEMDAVELTNRIDTKYVFHRSLLPEILSELTPFYKLLTIDGHNLHLYETLYFDDENHNLYLNHHNQRGNRFKLRLRRYGTSASCFMEVKRKTNTGRTIKSRSKTTGFELQLAQEQENFFRTKSGHTDGKWKFATKINFHRITLVSLDPPERMTFDLDLTFMNHQESKALNNLIVAEVKQGSKAPSHFIHAMKQRHIHPFSISKYCLGLSMLNPGLKQNLFKKQQTIIQKIQNRA